MACAPDPPAAGLGQLEPRFSGDVSPDHPPGCLVGMYTGDPDRTLFVGAELAIRVTAPGTRVFPLALFDAIPGFSFADADFIHIDAGECWQGPRAGPSPSREYAIGPLESAGGPAPARMGAWGRPKATHR